MFFSKATFVSLANKAGHIFKVLRFLFAIDHSSWPVKSSHCLKFKELSIIEDSSLNRLLFFVKFCSSLENSISPLLARGTFPLEACWKFEVA